MMPSFARDSVKVIRPEITEERGTTIRNWKHAIEHTIEGCSYQPSSSASAWSDPNQNQTVRGVLYLPPESDICAGDAVEVDGARFLVEGVPHTWHSPSGRVDNMTVQLVDWRGLQDASQS